jgi:predicted transposase YdaD
VTSIPHDALFKAAFENPANAAALFRQRLPPVLALAIDWDSLTLEPGTFVDPSLADRHSDLRDADRLLRNLSQWVHEVHEALRAPSGIESFSRLLRYIALVCEDLHYEQFRTTIREQLPEAERTAMTMAEELIQMGRAEGLAQGLAQGSAAVLVRLLTRKFGDVSPEYRARIEASTPDRLELLAERTLFADTLASVFHDQ